MLCIIYKHFEITPSQPVHFKKKGPWTWLPVAAELTSKTHVLARLVMSAGFKWPEVDNILFTVSLFISK